MTNDNLTSLLARKVMGWSVGPDRYLTGHRGWIAKWRFQPTQKLEDALRLMDGAAVTNYTIGKDHEGEFWARVEIGGLTGEAKASSRPAAITLAVAQAVGIPVEGSAR
jgi:hypothetical protein